MLTIHGVPISVHTRKVLVDGYREAAAISQRAGDPIQAAGRLERPLSDAQDPGAHRRRSRPPRFLGDLRLPGAHAPDARALSGRDTGLCRGALVRGIRRRHDLSRGRARALRPEDHSPEHPEAGDRRRGDRDNPQHGAAAGLRLPGGRDPRRFRRRRTVHHRRHRDRLEPDQFPLSRLPARRRYPKLNSYFNKH